MKTKLKNALSAGNLIKTVSKAARKVIDRTTNIKPSISLHDCLMSGLALFKLKYPSLLQFDKDRLDPVRSNNLKNLFHVDRAPSDTALRERLDAVDPQLIRPLFKKVFAVAQRNKVLESFEYMNDAYLCSIDGTGYFSSSKIHCKNCCVKTLKDGSKTYYHQMLCAVLVHPNQQHVIPFCPEAIQKEDGSTKNDCERNASKRLLKDLKREHPHLKLIIVEDSLASNAPHIKLLEELGYQYILGVKPKDHKWLFDWVAASSSDIKESTDVDGNQHKFSYVNDAPLNASNEDVRINFLEHWETRPNGKVIHHTWVTNVALTDGNVTQVMKGGRARWKVENETINTLKTQEYNFGHNFGHGKANLSYVLAQLMMLAFLIDELGFLACRFVKSAKQVLLGKKRMWRVIRETFCFFYIANWEIFFECLIHGIKRGELLPDTS